ncbi:hypothetical protein ACLB1N_37110 [Escherichia coli]
MDISGMQAILHISENVRPLTTFERARLQTLPEDLNLKVQKQIWSK